MTAPFPRKQARAALEESATFFERFLHDPLSVASPFASSERMVRKLLGQLDWARFKVVVEYGSGTGAFTRYAVQHMAHDARFFALDTDPAFTRSLRETLPDPRLIPLTDSAEQAAERLAAYGVDHVDCIISGLPFSSLEAGQADWILRQSQQLLGTTGIFTAYQVRSALEPLLRKRFAEVRKSYEWRNLPPCHLYWASGGRPSV